MNLHDLEKTCKKRKRIGRGGSRGGTSGRGHKGQRARSGGKSKTAATFEGGQMPLHRRLPKRGFNNTRFARPWSIVHTGDLERCFKDGDHVTKQLLYEKKLINNQQYSVKILIGGKPLTKKLEISVDALSKTAQSAVTALGGSIKAPLKRV